MDYVAMLDWLWSLAAEIAAPAAGGGGFTVAAMLVYKQISKRQAERRESIKKAIERLSHRVDKIEDEVVTHEQCDAFREALNTKVESSNEAISWIKDALASGDRKMETILEKVSELQVAVAVLAAREKGGGEG